MYPFAPAKSFLMFAFHSSVNDCYISLTKRYICGLCGLEVRKRGYNIGSSATTETCELIGCPCDLSTAVTFMHSAKEVHPYAACGG